MDKVRMVEVEVEAGCQSANSFPYHSYSSHYICTLRSRGAYSAHIEFDYFSESAALKRCRLCQQNLLI